MSKKLLVATIAFFTFSIAGQAEEWTLPGINGHAPDVWVGDRNWTKDLGNPMDDEGASWGLYYQGQATGDYEPMVFGDAFSYYFTWRSTEAKDLGEGLGEFPEFMYKERSLTHTGAKNTPGDGPCSMVTFEPPSAGKYQLDLEGTAFVQIPAAGNVRLKVLVVDAALKTVKEVKAIDVESTDIASLSEVIEVKSGESIAVTFQSINPESSGCGNSSIAFETFKVTRE